MRLRERFSRPRVQLMHGPNYFLPAWAERGVVTVHDLSVFRYPETHPPERIASFDKRFGASLERAEHLITDCETVRAEVIDFTGFPASRVTAVPLGLSPAFRPMHASGSKTTLSRLGVPADGYGLTVSSLEPRKRIGHLLRAWRLLPERLRTRYPLVIAGAAGWRNEGLLEEIRAAAGEGWVIPLSFVPEEQLPVLYAGARLFVYPSRYEGFGLPPLEAMASGVPTLVSQGTCLEEVTGGAAMLVDPEDEQDFARRLEQSLEDDEWRNPAVSAGIQVAKAYSWERCLNETIGVYQRVIGGRRTDLGLD